MDLKLDGSNDLSISSGDIETVSGIDEAGQRIKDRLLTYLGEWFLNLSFGVDYIGRIMVKNPRTNVISAHLRSEILKSAQGQFTDFSFGLENRQLTVNYSMTIDKETITDEITP